MASSGTYNFNPAISDFVIEAFERCLIRSSALTAEHMFSARMSANLVQSMWTNLGVNLWKQKLLSVPLVQGIMTYAVPSNVIMMLDAYITQYSMGSPVNLGVAFTTQINSSTVKINYPNHGLSVGNWVNVIIYTSVGGLIIYGFYQVASVPDLNNFTIAAASNATSTATATGQVPIFTVTANSNIVSVNLPNHGFVAGGTFVVQIGQTLGGLNLFGTYTVLGVTDANNFTFTAAYSAGSNASGAENGGQTQIAGQQVAAAPIDRVMGPISRTDYASLPNKTEQGFPTVYFFLRLINPTVTIWQVPDGNGPYVLNYWCYTQQQDANATMGQTVDIPFRFQEAWAASLAYHLSRKWAQALEETREKDMDKAVAIAMAEDRERVELNISPQMEGYFQ